MPTMFQRRHYQAVADVLADARAKANSETDLFALQFSRSLLDTLTVEFSNIFATDNPRFSKERFAEAAKTVGPLSKRRF